MNYYYYYCQLGGARDSDGGGGDTGNASGRRLRSISAAANLAAPFMVINALPRCSAIDSR